MAARAATMLAAYPPSLWPQGHAQIGFLFPPPWSSPGIRLDFQPQQDRGRIFGCKAVHEGDASLILCRPRLPQPRVKDIVERIHHRLRRPSSGSHEIDILRVARRGQMKRVEGRAAAKRERVVKDVVRKDRHQRAADDQILLDLRILRPRRLCPPFENVIAWNHRSISTSAFTNSFHASWRLDLPRGAPERSRTDSCTCARTYC